MKTLGQIAYEAEDQYWSQGLKHYVPPSFEDLTEATRESYEYAANAVAAEVRKQMGWRPIEEAPEGKNLVVGGSADGYCYTDILQKDKAINRSYTHYLRHPEPPRKENA
jgi:hypothetical protein